MESFIFIIDHLQKETFLQNYSIAKYLSNQYPLPNGAANALSISCTLHSSNKNAATDLHTSSPGPALISAAAEKVQQDTCVWLEQEVNSTSFPLNCTGRYSTLKQQLDDVCGLWDYVEKAISMLTANDILSFGGRAIQDWICGHELQNDLLIVESGIFTFTCPTSATTTRFVPTTDPVTTTIPPPRRG